MDFSESRQIDSDAEKALACTYSDASITAPSRGGGRGGGACVSEEGTLYNGREVAEFSVAVNDSPLVFFSIEDARKLVAERNRLLRQYEEINRKVQALAILVPEEMRERIFGTAATLTPNFGTGQVISQAVSPSSLKDAIVDVIDDALQILDQDDVESLIWLRPDFSDQTIYTPVEIAKQLERAARNGQIGKRGSKYYSRKMEPPSEVVPVVTGPTIISVAEKVLREAEESLEPWEIVSRMKLDPGLIDNSKLRPNAVYAALSRLVTRRIAHRDVDGGYRIGAK